MSSDVYSVRHLDQRAITNADQTELQAIRSGSAVTDAGLYDERLAGAVDDLEIAPDVAEERWDQQDLVLESEVGPIREEIVRRSKLIGEGYPFRLEANNLVYEPSALPIYEYLLGICQAPTITTKPYVRLPRTFERLTALLVKLYMGELSDYLHTGWPRSLSSGTTFQDAMQTLSKLSSNHREWRWDPAPGYPAATRKGGDEGIDFVVWKRALDERIGLIYVLGQCACGNDWPTKFNDLNVERIKPWFRPFCAVPPTRCFTTPFLLSDGNFVVAHNEAGWVLDRARLVRLAYSFAGDPDLLEWIPVLNQMFRLSQQAA